MLSNSCGVPKICILFLDFARFVILPKFVNKLARSIPVHIPVTLDRRIAKRPVFHNMSSKCAKILKI